MNHVSDALLMNFCTIGDQHRDPKGCLNNPSVRAIAQNRFQGYVRRYQRWLQTTPGLNESQVRAARFSSFSCLFMAPAQIVELNAFLDQL